MIGKALVMLCMSLCGKFIENARKMKDPRVPEHGKYVNIKILYECLNFHLHLSLGMIGLCWGSRVDPEYTIGLFALCLAGVAFKAAGSSHSPERLSFKDRDMLLGVWLPNAAGLASFVFGVFALTAKVAP